VARKEFTAKNGTQVVLREPVSADAKSMMKYINSVIRERRSGIVVDRPVTLKQEEAWLKARLEEIRKRSVVMLVAEVDGRIVGNCHVSRRPWKERHRAAIGVALVKNMRGIGIGRALMKETMDLSKKRMRGLESFDLSVLDYNEAAQVLYRSLGFVRVGCIPDAMKEDGEYSDEMLMVLPGKRRRRARKKGSA
jgi:RimJ/RimL family protein N-acetyltransferase